MSTRRVPLVAAAVGVLGALGLGLMVLGTSGAGAQTDAALFIRSMDVHDPAATKVAFVYTGAAGDVAGLKLNQNGADIAPTAPAAPLKADKGVVIVIDSGPNMDADGALIRAREGATKVVDASGADTEFAVVQAGDKATLVRDFTSDKSSIKTAIDGIGATKGSAIWSSLNIAGATLTKSSELQPNVLLIVGDSDNVKPQDESLGRSAITGAGAAMWAVERSGTFDPSSIDSLVSTTGGQVLVAGSVPQISDLTAQAGNTIGQQQYEVTYNANVAAGATIDLTLTVGSLSSNVNVLANGVYRGASLHPTITKTGSGLLPSLDNTAFFALALLLTLLAAVGVAYSLTSLFVKDDLSDMLQPYSEGYGTAVEEDDDGSLVKGALMQRAVALTEQVAENQGLLTRAEGALERANLPLRAGEALFFYAAIVVLVTLFGLFYTRNVVTGIVIGAIAAWLPIAIVNYIAKKRRKKFMSLLPDTLSLLSGTLRAGYSLMQGVEAVSQEVDEPMGLELRRVITESRLGRPLEESLQASADRMNSADFAWAVMAIGIQREVGGNLSELLLTVADTMIQRERLRRDVAALTAEGRMSAIILAGLPPTLGLVMWVLNPEYINVLFTDTLGIIMLIAAGVAMLVGFLWMRKIITIEI